MCVPDKIQHYIGLKFDWIFPLPDNNEKRPTPMLSSQSFLKVGIETTNLTTPNSLVIMV